MPQRSRLRCAKKKDGICYYNNHKYTVTATNIDTGKILFIVKNLDDQYTGVWSYAMDLLITSYIPVIYDVSIYNMFTVTCYNSDGIIINTIDYTMNENN